MKNKFFTPKNLLGLFAIASLLWTFALAASTRAEVVPDPPAGCSAGITGKATTRTELLAAMKKSSNSAAIAEVKPIPQAGEPAASKNCASVDSCGSRIGCFKVFGGGSQYKYRNGIPACVQQDRNCYDVQCKVKSYSTKNCSGDPDEEGWLPNRGCKTQKAVSVGVTPR